MLFSNIAILNEDFGVTGGVDVAIDGAYIASIMPSGAGAVREVGEADVAGGTAGPDAPSGAGMPTGGIGRVIDGRGKLLVPGFYNAHGHMPMTLLRGYGENMALMDWLNKIMPFEDKLTGEDCYHAAMLAMAESFANGIVSSSDQYFFCEDIVRAAAESGGKLNASRGLSFFDEILDLTGFGPYRESRKLFHEYHGAEDGRIRVDVGLHAEYTATPGLLEAVAGLLSETGAPVHVHISETRTEHEECKGRHGGKTPTQALAAGGIFANGGLAAHCVWVEEVDADILKESGMTAVSCPVSNMKLACGIARVPLLLEKGIAVALGTDSVASNNSLNFFETMKMLVLATNARFGETTLITPAEALYAATRAGALAQGRQDCGYIKEGFRADIVMLDLMSPSLNPVHEMANNLVFSASNRDILMTLVDGRAVYERGAFPTIDVERIAAEVAGARRRILGELEAEAGAT